MIHFQSRFQDEADPYQADLAEQDVLLEEALIHIRRLTHQLARALDYSALPPEAINKAESICHVASRFVNQFDDVNDIVSDDFHQ
ncbi:hypothetical protein G4Y79_20770 [Phototrophicus methaneseepsis]|uniref:Uncharacterized protein n=1 Tax=Phototrophicus methaneseepsis TaxID=2710758 RepID=A0A7S8E812_9CHLR|nr:hypothetical protein [Phototrophicus methaneseepsis]QPC82090.1 hypothetical protein G4Y79_20770 [Phototrophicus methaneseepsis]